MIAADIFSPDVTFFFFYLEEKDNNNTYNYIILHIVLVLLSRVGTESGNSQFL